MSGDPVDASPSALGNRHNSLLGTEPPLAGSENLHRRAEQVMPGGNARTSVFRSPYPVYFASGKGATVTDVDGNQYLDFDNNFTSLIHGHAHPDIVDALTSQSALATCFGAPTRSEIELAELLCDRVPHFEHVRFMNSGTEAVMNAVKAARALTGRRLIAKFEGAYHGSYDPVEVGLDNGPENWGDSKAPNKVPVCSGTPTGLVQDTVVIPFNDLTATASILNEVRDDLAAVLVDPLASKVGLFPIQADYLTFLRQFTEQHGILLIADEVLNFRLSYGGAMTRFGVESDLCAFGKIIGGGMPVGAVAGRRDFMKAFDPSGGKPAVPQAGTFSANPMTMVAGLAAMRAMTPEAFAELDRLGDYVRSSLDAMLAEESLPFSVTGMASLARLHPHATAPESYRQAYQNADERKLIAAVCRLALRGGINLPPMGLICLSTPMDDDHVDHLVEALRACLLELIRGGFVRANRLEPEGVIP